MWEIAWTFMNIHCQVISAPDCLDSSNSSRSGVKKEEDITDWWWKWLDKWSSTTLLFTYNEQDDIDELGIRTTVNAWLGPYKLITTEIP